MAYYNSNLPYEKSIRKHRNTGYGLENLYPFSILNPQDEKMLP